jgi:hypothetical protein
VSTPVSVTGLAFGFVYWILRFFHYRRTLPLLRRRSVPVFARVWIGFVTLLLTAVGVGMLVVFSQPLPVAGRVVAIIGIPASAAYVVVILGPRGARQG